MSTAAPRERRSAGEENRTFFCAQARRGDDLHNRRRPTGVFLSPCFPLEMTTASHNPEQPRFTIPKVKNSKEEFFHPLSLFALPPPAGDLAISLYVIRS